MNKLNKFIIASFVTFLVGFFYNMASTIIELNHRIGVLEDQMETTMNILTDDGHRIMED